MLGQGPARPGADDRRSGAVQPVFCSDDTALAIAEMENVPTNAAMARLVSVNSSVATTSIWVYISKGSFAATNSDFMLMVTGR